jgi:hypothetical protein
MPRQKEKLSAQSQAFIDAARALECDESEERFDEALRKSRVSYVKQLYPYVIVNRNANGYFWGSVLRRDKRRASPPPP